MIRKLALIVIVLLISIIFPQKTFAQGVYNCSYDIFSGDCAPSPSTPTQRGCDFGFRPDASVCSKFKNNYDGCRGVPNTTCIQDTSIQTCGSLGKVCCNVDLVAGLRASCNSPLVCRDRVCVDPARPFQQGAAGGIPGYLCDESHIKTAIGCIPIGDQNALIGFILSWAIGIAGGIAFLLILMAGFQIMTARGDPKRLQAGQELLTSAIGGIILLIFSVFILRVIGVDILRITGFNTNAPSTNQQ